MTGGNAALLARMGELLRELGEIQRELAGDGDDQAGIDAATEAELREMAAMDGAKMRGRGGRR